jgi:hypothetical protein
MRFVVTGTSGDPLRTAAISARMKSVAIQVVKRFQSRLRPCVVLSPRVEGDSISSQSERLWLQKPFHQARLSASRVP